jgi:predicted membrane channel-forming protein YqfA (hemolysin III family)
MSQIRIDGSTLSITDHQFKAITLVIVSSLISLLTYLVQNPTIPTLSIIIFAVQLLASGFLLFSKNGTVTNSEYRFFLYVLAQIIFTALQSFVVNGAIITDRVAIFAALLQLATNIGTLLEGEWSVPAAP